MPRVLITGAAGFLGSHLCDRFIADGMEVLGMDNLITGNMDNLEHLMGHPKFIFYNADISNFVHVPGKLNYILHFASPASPIDYLKIPIQTKSKFLGDTQPSGFSDAEKVAYFSSLYVGSIWRSFGSSSNRRVLWKRQSSRPRGFMMKPSDLWKR